MVLVFDEACVFVFDEVGVSVGVWWGVCKYWCLMVLVFNEVIVSVGKVENWVYFLFSKGIVMKDGEVLLEWFLEECTELGSI